MTPAPPQGDREDHGFDLDVRLAPVARKGAEALPGTPPPNTVSCEKCGTQYSCVGCS